MLGCMGIKCFMIEKTGERSPKGFDFYRRADTGEIGPFLNPAPDRTPPGAMWWSDWLSEWGFKRAMNYPAWEGKPHSYHPDAQGRCLFVATPGGIWCIDSRASNCTLPNDNEHRCWCRHGDAPLITVDKVGLTCSAGAGSIQSGDWHGFLRNGELVQ